MLPVGFMAWRIGEILELEAQADWIQAAGFDAIGLHASPGEPGVWRGVDPALTDAAARRRLKRALSPFARREVHAPFDLTLTSAELPGVVDRLTPILQFAGDIGAAILTLHGEAPDVSGNGSAAWEATLDRLDTLASEAHVTIGLELMSGFERLRVHRRPHIGVTLDVGHMYLNKGAGLRPYRTLGALVKELGSLIVHLHVHDYDGLHDHIELGTGRVDFEDLVRSLEVIRYQGALCLELNPDRVPPEGIRRSLAYLRERLESP